MRNWELPGRTGTTACRAVARWFYGSAGTYPGGRADSRARRFAHLWAGVIARG